MDRTQACGVCNAGSIPAEGTRIAKAGACLRLCAVLALAESNGEDWGPVSKRGCPSVVRRRNFQTRKFRALDSIPT